MLQARNAPPAANARPLAPPNPQAKRLIPRPPAALLRRRRLRRIARPQLAAANTGATIAAPLLIGGGILALVWLGRNAA